VAGATGNPSRPEKDRDALVDVGAVWAMAHGLADLLVAGRLPSLGGLPERSRHQAILAILSRSLAGADHPPA
jgi:purine-cytosine permease-like protein